jgi:hypothetical protein
VSSLSPQARLDTARSEYERVRDLAAGGDRNAMGRIADVVAEYRDQAASFWSSSEQYAAIFAETDATLANLETQATSQIAISEQQLAVMQTQVDGLTAANDNLITLTQATTDLRAAVDAYLGAGGSFSDPMNANMLAAVSAAQAAVTVSAASVDATAMIARSSAQIADALLALPHVIGSAISATQIATKPLEVEKMPSLMDRIFNTTGSSQGLFDRIFNWMPGLADGGWTGNMGTSSVAGVVHGQEFVVPAPYAAQNRGALESLASGRGWGGGGGDSREVVSAITNGARVSAQGFTAVVTELRSVKEELAGVKEEQARTRREMQFHAGKPARATGTR